MRINNSFNPFDQKLKDRPAGARTQRLRSRKPAVNKQAQGRQPSTLPWLVLLLVVLPLLNACKSQDGNGRHAHTNALIDESSPYLLQHAHNPVNWYPWKEEALAKAKAENKLLIISIGYAACHWCHVMEHESFEDTTVSRIMNEHFVSIKVDREERPDIDDVYMTACQMATGRGCGWPLNAFALPDGRPVWAGTYFPKKQWLEILEYFVKLYQEEPEKLEEYATKITEGILANDRIEFGKETSPLSSARLEEATTAMLADIDFVNGGRKGSPKFPMPNNYEFLLSMAKQYQNEEAAKAVEVTLTEIAKGGIYDHLGGGFARYSTDSRWHIPHFEKMLYDNAQLVSLFSKAYQFTKNPLYERVVRETLDFIEREMTSPEGAFYSSFDADSEGEEGKFYVWQQEEIDSILQDPQLSELFGAYYNITKSGNWKEEQTNVLYVRKDLEDVAGRINLPLSKAQEQLALAKDKLFRARTQRTYPGLDDKILTSWNALMLLAYTDAFRAFGDESYRQAALNNARFIQEKALQADFRLNRNYKDGQSVINAFLDDYAHVIQAFTGLYEITFDEAWLHQAQKLADYTFTHFFDQETNLFYYTSDEDPALIARKKELADNVIPASNSTMARNLHTLGLYFYKEDFLEKARQMLAAMENTIAESSTPTYYSNWYLLYQDLLNPPYEVAIVGADWETKRSEMQRHYLPNALFLGGAAEGSLQLLENKLIEGETRIYVCRDKICKLPVTESDRAIELMLDAGY
jgi:uncharacterized protein YyaL (SSP411 family)